MINRSDPDGKKNKLCEGLSSQVGSAFLLKTVSDKSILVINIILRSLVIWVLKKLKSPNKSTETQRIMICVFFIQFFNTGPLLILTNADLSQVGLPLLDVVKAGFHPDFTVRWYKDVGQIILDTMTINIFIPIFELLGSIGTKTLLRILDKKFRSDEWKTKKKTIESYIDLYAGPEFYMHQKYSNIINIAFMTFMFGAGIPLLFPIALLSFIVIYILERILVAYYYRAPSMMDDKLSRTAI
jgi:hypothetical protein